MKYPWTDDELRAAIIETRSWRGVARALGAKGHSGGAVRRIKARAAALGLDVSHFTAQRTWSDEQLKQAVGDAWTWGEVVRALKLADNDKTRLIVKGHAVRLDLDISKFDPTPTPFPPISVVEPSPTNLRFAGEWIAIAWFALRGLPVAVPAQHQAYDLLVSFPDGVQRVQVKTSVFRAANASWTVGIGQRPYTLDKTAGRRPYDPDELDFFFVIDGEGSLYLIPSKTVAGRVAINVGAYKEYIVGDASSFLATPTRSAAK